MFFTRKKEAFGAKLRKMDIFGTYIGLTYKGKHTYHTNFGTFLTVIVIIIVSVQTGIGLSDVLQERIVNISKDDQYVDVDIAGSFNPGKLGFNFGFGILGTEVDPAYGRFDLTHKKKINGVTKERTKIETSKCDH